MLENEEAMLDNEEEDFPEESGHERLARQRPSDYRMSVDVTDVPNTAYPFGPVGKSAQLSPQVAYVNVDAAVKRRVFAVENLP